MSVKYWLFSGIIQTLKGRQSPRKLAPVQIRCSRASNFLLALGDIEEHRLVWLGPLEVEAFFHTVRCRKNKRRLWCAVWYT